MSECNSDIEQVNVKKQLMLGNIKYKIAPLSPFIIACKKDARTLQEEHQL